MTWTTAIRATLVLAAILPAGTTAAQDGFLHAKGDRIVDGQGREVLLRGMGLGGWMLQEGYMLGIKKEGTQHSIRARIADLIGNDDTERFYALWRQHHMTRADVDRLGADGFNSVRLAMHYNLFTLPIEREPVKGQDTWLPTGFEMVDNLVAWCKANRIYVILDLHAAPGGQGRDANISDYDPSKPSLWESDENRRKTVALWRKLAERYANEPWIGGYDILNEPNWTFEGKDKNGREDLSNQPIWDLYKAITRAIREVDTHHLIVVEGNGWGNNYSGFPGPWDANLVMSFHKYWNPNTDAEIQKFLALRTQYRVPIWLGESGENTNEWFRECVDLVERHHIGWAWWPYKKLTTASAIMTVTAPDDFQKVVAYWNGEGARPSAETARRGLFELVENLKADRCRYNADVSKALIPTGRAAGAPLTAMTFNIRVGLAPDGDDHWTKRRDQLFAMLRDQHPDVIGLQEALDYQIDEILAGVPGYAYVGVARGDGQRKGEYAAILYRTDRLAVRRTDTFWFSDTPTVVGSKTWGNNYERICTWAYFEDRHGVPFYVFNVHLDHESQPSRERSAALLLERVTSRGPAAPVVVMGDFNAGEQNPAVAAMRGAMRDSFRVRQPEATEVGTFTAFKFGTTRGDKIDYVFVSDGIEVLDAAIVRASVGGHYPSDHFPVTATLRMR